jgi:hypothetical protein
MVSEIGNRLSTLGDHAKEYLASSRMERLDRDNDRMRGEIALLRDELQEERKARKDTVKWLRELKEHQTVKVKQGHRSGMLLTAVIAAAATYVLGSKAGRERYQQILEFIGRLKHALRQEMKDLPGRVSPARELWVKSLGMSAVIQPPEEDKSVKTAIGAARAELTREESLQGS